MSPRKLFLPFLLFILSASGVQAKTVVIGAGFGKVTQNGMSGLQPGDVLAIMPGKYTGGYFMNLKGITITNNGGTVIFNGNVTLDGLADCTFQNFQFKDVNGVSIRWENNSRRCIERNIAFYNCSGSCNDATDHNPYTGDTLSLKLYMCVFDSLTLFKSGQIMLANYGDAKAGAAYTDSLVFSRMKVDSTTTDGTEIRGVFFRLDAHDWVVNYKGFNQLSGDVGMVYMIGSGKIHNLYKNGGRGYISRARVVGLGKSQNIYFYNNIDLNSYDYGMIDARTEPDQVTKYTYNGNCYIYNNTGGNLQDHMGYWASIAVVGTFAPPFNCVVRNNLGFNQMTNGKPPITVNQSSNTWISDSANNLYFAKPDGVVDPVTGVPVAGSPVLGKGVTVPWITEDIYHTARTGAYDIGAVQHGGSPITPPPNQLPVAVVGAAQTITLPVSTAPLDGTKSYDPDGSVSKYAWSLVSGPGGIIANATAASTTVSGLTQGIYVLKLTVTDNNNGTASKLDTIVVKAVANLPPISNAGADQTITLPVNSVTVDGSASKDQDNGGLISSYAWSQSSGPSSATIATATKAGTTISALVQGTYIFKLKVTDASGATATDSLIITVKMAANVPPVANAGANQTIQLPVNQVALDGTGSAAPSGTITSYSWTQVSGPSSASWSAATASKTNATALVAGTYVFQLTVVDNNNAKATDQVTITVNAAANIPPVANAGSSITITLPTNTATLDGTKSSDADGTISTYSWAMISGPNTPGSTGSNSSKLSLTGLVAGQYSYQLTVTDNKGGSASAQVKITVVAPANKAPIANAGTDQTITAPANSVNLNGSASYDPDGTIASYSWVLKTGTGSITISNGNTSKPSVVGLTTGTYSFQLTVTDNSGATSTDLVTVTVNPQPAAPNQAPVANAGNNQTITAPSASVVLNGSSSFDPDGTITKYTWTQVSGPNTGVVLGNGTVSPSVSGLAVGTYTFQLLVTDNDGATNTDQVTVTVLAAVPKVNLSPIAKAGSDTTIYLPTNTFQLNAIGSHDPDGNITTFQWQELSGPNTASASSLFGAKVDIGNLVAGVYQFQLTVTDNDGSKSTTSVKITVVDNLSASKGADQFILFPNPAHDVITGKLTSSTNGNIKVNVYDMNGRIIFADQTEKSSEVFQKTYDISKMVSGTYTIQIIIGNNKTMITKFIKQ